MKTTTTKPSPDPVRIINDLDPAEIVRRIDSIDRERAALMVLLRAARRARQPRDTQRDTGGANHAR